MILLPRRVERSDEMLRNLIAEIARKNLRYRDLAEVTDNTERSIGNKIACRTEFTRKEMLQIKKKLFPECTLDYLFEQKDEQEE